MLLVIRFIQPSIHFVLDICALSFETGPCRDSQTRFYFEESRGECLEFIYGGCEGNANNFQRIETCQRSCFRETSRPTRYTPTDTDRETDRDTGRDTTVTGAGRF